MNAGGTDSRHTAIVTPHSVFRPENIRTGSVEFAANLEDAQRPNGRIVLELDAVTD
jgi:hypothetical protein